MGVQKANAEAKKQAGIPAKKKLPVEFHPKAVSLSEMLFGGGGATLSAPGGAFLRRAAMDAAESVLPGDMVRHARSISRLKLHQVDVTCADWQAAFVTWVVNTDAS